MHRLLPPILALAASACTARTPAPPITPHTPETPRAAVRTPGADPLAFTGSLREESFPLARPPVVDPAKLPLRPAPAALPRAPAVCDAFVNRAPAAPGSCADAAAATAALDAALDEADVAKRDARLRGVEGCSGLPAGLARAVRAELAPIACGEAIVAPVLTGAPSAASPIGGPVHHALVGLAVASRFARTAMAPPTLSAPFTRARVSEFSNGPMKSWFVDQASMIEEISRAAVELPYYAKAISAIEAGVAEMRLVEALRGAPLPDEIANDKELQSEYYAALDEHLEHRKDRGRDAALDGLREMALVGAIHDPRVDRARALLSKLYGGRRIDALDALLVPPLAPPKLATAEERLAARLPTFYAGLLLDEKAATRAGTLRAFLEKGLPLPQRQALAGAELTPEMRGTYARARLELGRCYWRAVDFDQAVAVAATWPDVASRPNDATLVLAIALALRNGPEDAAEMMRNAPLPLTRMGDVTALDYVAQQFATSPVSGMALFDAGAIKQLVAPQGADAAYWKDVARRFHEAAALLPDPAKHAAEDRASAADQIAAAIK